MHDETPFYFGGIILKPTLYYHSLSYTHFVVPSIFQTRI